jgi:hypothetical protein
MGALSLLIDAPCEFTQPVQIGSAILFSCCSSYSHILLFHATSKKRDAKGKICIVYMK